jgi:hypothetical protein
LYVMNYDAAEISSNQDILPVSTILCFRDKKHTVCVGVIYLFMNLVGVTEHERDRTGVTVGQGLHYSSTPSNNRP